MQDSPYRCSWLSIIRRSNFVSRDLAWGGLLVPSTVSSAAAPTPTRPTANASVNILFMILGFLLLQSCFRHCASADFLSTRDFGIKCCRSICGARHSCRFNIQSHSRVEARGSPRPKSALLSRTEIQIPQNIKIIPLINPICVSKNNFDKVEALESFFRARICGTAANLPTR